MPESNLKVIGVRWTSSVTSHGSSSSSPNSPRKAVACASVGVAALLSLLSFACLPPKGGSSHLLEARRRGWRWRRLGLVPHDGLLAGYELFLTKVADSFFQRYQAAFSSIDGRGAY